MFALNKIFFWNNVDDFDEKQESDSTELKIENDEEDSGKPSYESRTGETNYQKPAIVDHAFQKIYRYPYISILDYEEMKPYFDTTYFGYGYNYGFNHQSKDAMEVGKRDLQLSFQNTLEKIQKKIEQEVIKIESHLSYIDDSYPSIQALLNKLLIKLKGDLQLIEKQLNLSNQFKGWIENAFNKFRIGFHQGLKKSVLVDFYGKSDETREKQ